MKINLVKEEKTPKLGDIIETVDGLYYLVIYNPDNELYHLMKMPECKLLNPGCAFVSNLIIQHFVVEEIPNMKLYESDDLEIVYKNKE